MKEFIIAIGLILSPDSDFFKFFGKTGVIKKQ